MRLPGQRGLIVDQGTGAVVERIDFDEWGNVASDSNPGWMPFGFDGGMADPATGLVRFGARDYDARSGRWTAKDPIRFLAGLELLYSFTGSDPVNLFDQSGLDFYVQSGNPDSQAALDSLRNDPRSAALVSLLENDHNILISLHDSPGLAGSPDPYDPTLVNGGGRMTLPSSRWGCSKGPDVYHVGIDPALLPGTQLLYHELIHVEQNLGVGAEGPIIPGSIDKPTLEQWARDATDAFVAAGRKLSPQYELP